MMDDCEHRYSIRSNGTYVCELCTRVAGSSSGNDLNILAFNAFRYALGKKNYLVDAVSQALINSRFHLKSDIKQRICTEIQEAIDLDKAGMDCDIEEWKRVMEEFKCTR